jgi:hypothetical protein
MLARLLPLALCGALALCGVLGAASARADELPTGTFKIRSSHGTCVELTSGYPQGRACATANLNQQFIGDLITDQIRSVGRLGQCLAASVSTVVDVDDCNASAAQQKWAVEPEDGGYLIYSLAYQDPYRCMNVSAGVGELLSVFECNDGVDYVFSLPLI